MNYKLAVLALGMTLLITSFLVSEESYDFQLYDTYFIVGWAGTLRLLGLLCCLFGGSYFLANRRTIKNQE